MEIIFKKTKNKFTERIRPYILEAAEAYRAYHRINDVPENSIKRKTILFFDEFDKLLVYGSTDSGGNDVNRNIVHNLYSAISDNSSNYNVNTNQVLFIFAGAFERIYKTRKKPTLLHGDYN